jgi:hypothetical protein
MANTPKQLFRGAATTTTTTTLYTVPSATTTIVTEIIASNTAASSATFTVYLNGTLVANTVTVAANDSTVIPMKQVLAATQTVQGGASATTVNLHISGIEIA